MGKRERLLIQRSALFFAAVITSLTVVVPSAKGQAYHSPMFTPHVPDHVAEKGEAAGTVNLDSNTRFQSMQRGYFDAGAASGLASVQPGCVYHAVHEETNGMHSGYAGAIPAGVSFASDAH